MFSDIKMNKSEAILGHNKDGQESKMAANAKHSKSNKIKFFSRMAWHMFLIFCMRHHLWDLGFEKFQNEKNICRIR